MIEIFQGSNSSVLCAGVVISKSASVSDIWVKHKVWETIASAAWDSFIIISEVQSSILYFVERFSIFIFVIKNSIFPACSLTQVTRTWSFSCFKLVSIVSIFDKILHVLINMDMNYNLRVICNMAIKFRQIFLFSSYLFNPFHHELFGDKV